MDEGDAATYWCYQCSRMVDPIMEVEIKCPLCQGGFVEDMESAVASDRTRDADESDAVFLSTPTWVMSTSSRARRNRRIVLEDSDDDDNGSHQRDEESEPGHEVESFVLRRRRSFAAILRHLQGSQAGILSESENSESNNRTREGRQIRDRERVILINPFSRTIIVQGSYDSNHNSENQPIGSLGDYFMGPGLDMLLQHLSENDPNRYGTPPAQKEAVEAMPTVKIESCLPCSVCLDDLEIGSEAKEMPCHHKFHRECILPWLELHSSCPVCRYQLPSDDSKLSTNTTTNRNDNSSRDGNANGDRDGNSHNGGGRGGGRGDTRGRFSVHLPWPFGSLFSSSGSQSSNANSTSTSSSSTGASSSEP